MINLSCQLAKPFNKHKKQHSTDSTNTQSKRKFLSLVSTQLAMNKPSKHTRTTSELKKQTLQAVANKKVEPNATNLKIKRYSAFSKLNGVKQEGVEARMQKFKKRLTNLSNLMNSNETTHLNSAEKDNVKKIFKPETPINRLLFESNYKQNLG